MLATRRYSITLGSKSNQNNNEKNLFAANNKQDQRLRAVINKQCTLYNSVYPICERCTVEKYL